MQFLIVIFNFEGTLCIVATVNVPQPAPDFKQHKIDNLQLLENKQIKHKWSATASHPTFVYIYKDLDADPSPKVVRIIIITTTVPVFSE